MSSIPSGAMPHPKEAKLAEGDGIKSVKAKAKAVVDKVKADPRAKSVTKAVRDNPKTAAAIGATVIAGAAAAIAAPLLMEKKPAAKKRAKPAARKKPAAAKKAPAKS